MVSKNEKVIREIKYDMNWIYTYISSYDLLTVSSSTLQEIFNNHEDYVTFDAIIQNKTINFANLKFSFNDEMEVKSIILEIKNQNPLVRVNSWFYDMKNENHIEDIVNKIDTNYLLVYPKYNEENDRCKYCLIESYIDRGIEPPKDIVSAWKKELEL